MPRWPGEGSRKAGGGGTAGPDTREVRDTLAGTGQGLYCSFTSPGSSTGARS